MPLEPAGRRGQRLSCELEKAATTCLVLAGGRGARVTRIAHGQAKPMLRVGGRPFLEYVIRQLSAQGFDDLVLCTGYQDQSIRAHFQGGDAWRVRLRYSHEVEPLGTGGALRRGSALCRGETFLALNGDSWLEADLPHLLEKHLGAGAVATLALVHVEDATRFGRVNLSEDGKIRSFVEKGSTGPGLINAGVYVFARSLFQSAPAAPMSLEHDLLPTLVGRGLYGVPVHGFFVDIGVPEDYERLARNPEPLGRFLKIPTVRSFHADPWQSSATH